MLSGDEFYDDEVTSGPMDYPLEGAVPTAVQNAWNEAHQRTITHGEEVALLRTNAHVPKSSGFVDDDGAEHRVTVCAASHPGIGPVPWPCETSRWVALYDELREATIQSAINAVLEAT